jgi:hypothetical protein
MRSAEELSLSYGKGSQPLPGRFHLHSKDKLTF